MAMVLPGYFTAEQVRALPDDGNRYETVFGELLVTPAPGGFHQRVLTRLSDALGPYLASHHCEDLLSSPADVSFGSDTMVQPDLFVADCSVFNRTGSWLDLGPLHLVVEVLSPSTARHDRFTKRRLYQTQRVPTYWIVDIDHRRVEVWIPDATEPMIVADELRWRHPAFDDSCVVDVARLFAGMGE